MNPRESISMDAVRATFLSNLSYLVDERGVRVGTISKALGIRSAAVSNWRGGTRMPSLPHLLVLAEMFSRNLGETIHIDDLLTRRLDPLDELA